MVTKKHGVIIETRSEARQAEPGPSVPLLLSVSLMFVVLGMAVVWGQVGDFYPCRKRWTSNFAVHDPVYFRAAFCCSDSVTASLRLRATENPPARSSEERSENQTRYPLMKERHHA
jgi:hypothetical protein